MQRAMTPSFGASRPGLSSRQPRREWFASCSPELVGVRPYHLGHSFVSLLLAEGASVVEVARQAEHSPTVALSTYAHVIEELEGAERQPAEVVIRQARDELVPLTYAWADQHGNG